MSRMDDLRAASWVVLRAAYLTALSGSRDPRELSIDEQNHRLGPFISRMVQQADMFDDLLIQAAAEGQVILVEEMDKDHRAREDERALARAKIQELGAVAPERSVPWWKRVIG